MKMWKKWIALLLAAAMLFALTGCGLSAAQQILDELSVESSPTVQPGAPDTPDMPPEPTGAEDPHPVGLLSIPREIGEYDGALDLTCLWEEVALRDTDAAAFPALADALTRLSAAEKQSARQQADDQRETAQEIGADGEYLLELVYESNFTVRRADTNFVSLLYRSYRYAGGVHPSGYYTGVTLDSRTGERMALTDIFTDAAVLAQAIMDELYANYPAEAFYDGVNTASMQQNIEADLLQWVLDPAGLTVIFPEYEIAPYAAGTITVSIPYSWYPEQFDIRCTQLPAAYAVELDPLSAVPVFFDVDAADDYLDTVAVELVMQDAWYAEQVLVDINGSEHVLLDQVIGWQRIFLLRLEDGGTGVYLFAGDGPQTNLYIRTLNSDGICGTDELFGADLPSRYIQEDGIYIELLTDPGNFRLSFFVEMLSSMFGTQTFRAQPDGAPIRQQEVYTLESDIVLTLLQPMTFETGGPGEASGEKEFPAGTQFTFLATDGEGWVDMSSDTGETVRIYVDKSDWPDRVNGKDVFECFDGMQYAG